MSEFGQLHSTYIVNCGFSSFLCYTCIMLNILTIHGIRKTSSLPKPLKTLLLSFAVSDVGVGLLAQPFYTSLLVKWLQQNNPGCIAYTAFFIVLSLFSTVSFCGVVAISVDRFLAIHIHLRYQEIVTHRRVVAVVISIWMLSTILSLKWFLAPTDVPFSVIFVLGALGFVLTPISYTRIYLAVRRHKNHIQSLQVQQVAHAGELANFASTIKSAVGAFHVYLVYLVCYLPFYICLILIKTYGSNISLKRLFSFSCSLLCLNSSLNPVIYCWKMRHIRHAIMDILRNMSRYCNRNRASQ